MTIGDWITLAVDRLEQVGVGSARLDADLILAHILCVPREQVLTHPEDSLPRAKVTEANRLLAARLERRPLVHLTGQREFYGLNFKITPEVLTPRVETEDMVEVVIKSAPKNGHLLDVGTGSGAIAIAIKKHRSDLLVTASDVSHEALEVAKRNARKHATQIKFVQSDLFSAVSGQFDVITANLPYLRDDAELMPEVGYEPKVALLGGTDGLELYRIFIGSIKSHLKTGSFVLIEADPWQHADIIKLARPVGLNVLKDDYFILTLKFASNSPS